MAILNVSFRFELLVCFFSPFAIDYVRVVGKGIYVNWSRIIFFWSNHACLQTRCDNALCGVVKQLTTKAEYTRTNKGDPLLQGHPWRGKRMALSYYKGGLSWAFLHEIMGQFFVFF